MILDKTTQLILFALLAFQSTAFSWWDSGHMVVAKIAEERLNPRAKKEVHQLIDVMGSSCPDGATFVEAACWLDDIQNRGVLKLPWHCYAGPYCPDGFYSDQEIAKLGLKYEGNDCIAAIKKGIETLTDPQAGEWEKAFMLRVLLHAVGDIHCPMHCVQAYSEQFPQGDKGGVKFPLKGPDAIKHLHGLWDSIVLLGDVRLSRPLDGDGLRFVEALADRITAEYPENGLEEGTYPEKWARESHLAGKEAYLGIEVNTVPSEEYIQKSQKVACQRLALAGYRLANVLNECFPE
jgi:uncharacterized protein YaeQ